MDNEFNRCYIKIRTILEIDSKTIHEKLGTILEPSASSYTTVTRWAKRFRQGRENVSDHPRSARLHYSNLQVKIFNCFDKLSAMIHIQLMMKFYLIPLSHQTIEHIIHDCLTTKRVTSRWVPHQVTHEQRVKLCRENLAKFPGDYMTL